MRRKGETTRARLLASAERLFAEHGYEGVLMRQIAADAGTQLALIHYHFGTKLDIFRAIWEARYPDNFAKLREASSQSVDFSGPRSAVVRALVEFFWRPVAMHAEGADLQPFLTIGAREMVDPKEAERGVLRDFLDAPARFFIAGFARALPELTPQDVSWGYQAMTGVLTLHIADRDRVYRLSNGAIRPGDRGIETLIDFCVGGWLNLAQKRSGKPGRQQSTHAPSRGRHSRKASSRDVRGRGQPSHI